MSDFFLDFRAPELRERAARVAAAGLSFCDGTRVETLQRDSFTVVLTRVDDSDLWGPYAETSPQGLLVCLSGRVAFDQAEWDAAAKIKSPGGLACKAIANQFRQSGVGALEKLNGNFTVILHDPATTSVHLVTDRCGMHLAYGCEQSLVYSSHPDVLASVLGESQSWDEISLAEFLMTSRLTYPYTYYQRVRALETGCIYSFSARQQGVTAESPRRYFGFDFKISEQSREWDLAEQFAAAFKSAIKRRTLPLLGQVGVGLSGGLDSRALLSAAGPRPHIRAFTLFDEENVEFKAATAVARTCGIELVPIRRDPEFYGNTAELGVRISGGTGCITCNHYLGARQRLNELGIHNILTGCYCDYMFKGLALNTVESKLSRIQKLADFKLEFYDSLTFFDTPAREVVLDRLTTLFPESRNGHLSPEAWLAVERKRTFPLAYEEDLAQRVIPQRVMPWYVPIVDNDLLDIYLKTPPQFKLNSSLFKKMLTVLGPKELCRLPDSNTGAPVNAGWPSRAFHRFRSAAQNRLSQTFRSRMATTGSWPNWNHYFRQSKVIASIWNRPNAVARDFFVRILGNRFHDDVEAYLETDITLFQRLLTLKLWFDQRTAGANL